MKEQEKTLTAADFFTKNCYINAGEILQELHEEGVKGEAYVICSEAYGINNHVYVVPGNLKDSGLADDVQALHKAQARYRDLTVGDIRAIASEESGSVSRVTEECERSLADSKKLAKKFGLTSKGR